MPSPATCGRDRRSDHPWVGAVGLLGFAWLELCYHEPASPRAHIRSLGFTTLMIFSVPGIVVMLPVLGAMSDRFGLQVAMLVMAPVAIVAAFILLSAGPYISDDIAAASHGGSRTEQPSSLNVS